MFLGAGYDEVEGNGLRNMALDRELCLGIMSTEPDKISSSDEGPAVIEKFYRKHKDHGVILQLHEIRSYPACLLRPYLEGILPHARLRETLDPVSFCYEGKEIVAASHFVAKEMSTRFSTG